MFFRARRVGRKSATYPQIRRAPISTEKAHRIAYGCDYTRAATIGVTALVKIQPPKETGAFMRITVSVLSPPRIKQTSLEKLLGISLPVHVRASNFSALLKNQGGYFSSIPFACQYFV